MKHYAQVELDQCFLSVSGVTTQLAKTIWQVTSNWKKKAGVWSTKISIIHKQYYRQKNHPSLPYSAKGPWNKNLNLIFPIEYVLPKSLKVGHWLSQLQLSPAANLPPKGSSPSSTSPSGASGEGDLSRLGFDDFLGGTVRSIALPSQETMLPETNSHFAPENTSSQITIEASNHQFSGVNSLLVSGKLTYPG